MAMIGDALISYSINRLCEKLASSDLVKFARRKQLLDELKKLENTLRKIHAVLQDAEEKQITDRIVNIWLSELRDIAYDAEDIIDEFLTMSKIMAAEPESSNSSSKVWSFIPSCFMGLNPISVSFNVQMGSKIKGITARLQDTVRQKYELDLRENSFQRGSSFRERMPTTSLVDEYYVFGREQDKEAIIELLLGAEAGSNEIGVIPIVGMGGLGKTTLAQLVYNDEIVDAFFDLKVWVCVSEEFDVCRVTKTILQSVCHKTCDVNDLNLLQVKLKEKLKGRKFLVVLDDVWHENYDDWTLLRRPLEVGSPGSKIIVTTRSKDVSSAMGTVPAYHLTELSYDSCLSLFAQHALGRRNFDDHPNLKVIGEEIVKMCKGLPLAAKALGGLLRTKQSYAAWEDILNSKIWDLPEQKSSILPALRLSYHHLPSHLKQCFAYCAVFPKDYEFDRDELVLLWMAEGFIGQPKGMKHMEDVGREYFHDLSSRSFFQQSSSKESRFVMHDLINDLAKFVAGEICFNLNDKLEGDKAYTGLERARHLSFTRHTYEVSQRFKDFYKMKCLRTFMALPIYTSPWAACYYLSNNVLHDLLPKLKCLRVLCLSGYGMSELPQSICGLKHLRYFNLSRTKIKQLPESVGSLINLQTLILHGCRELTKLPQSIEKLVNLCHLDLSDTPKLQEMPLLIGNLKSLRILSKFVVQRDNGVCIKELRDLPHLQGELSILGLHNVVDIRDASGAILRDKHGLDELELGWSPNSDSQNQEGELLALDLLQPHKNLKKLRISFYGAKRFPCWLGDTPFTNIVSLNLYNCKNCMSLPSLGRLPSLKYLFIEGMDEVEEVGFEFYGDSYKPFPSLETLWFYNMLKWKHWSSSIRASEVVEEEFPRLCELSIQTCPKLIQNLPSRLPSLVKLIISQCPKLTYPGISLPSLHELNIEECNEEVLRRMVDHTSLTTLKIKSIPELTCLPEESVQFLRGLQSLVVSNCTELTSLWQKGAGLQNILCPEPLMTKDFPQFVSLEENLEFLNCSNLGTSPYVLQSVISLEELQIVSCPKLVSFVESGFLSMLRHLALKDCSALMSLPDGCLLEDLVIEDCPSLKLFPKGKFATSLKRLKIQCCVNLQSLPEGMMHNDYSSSSNNMSDLEILEIIDCPSLTLFPEGKLPTSLKTLKIWDCSQLEPLSGRMLHNNMSLEYISIWSYTLLTSFPECLHCLTHLTELSVNNCPGLKSFPETGLFVPTLKSLHINECTNLKYLPNQMQNLTSLQDLTISGCPSLLFFPKGGLPRNLTTLAIWDCENLESMSEWNLHGLNSLRDLSIAGGCFHDTVSFPDEKCLLPTTLTSICIGKLQNLEYLSMGLHNLTSLEELDTFSCPKLWSLPKEGLPATLGRLSIRDCPLLKRQCSKKKGAHWPMIAHIPCIEMDDENVN